MSRLGPLTTGKCAIIFLGSLVLLCACTVFALFAWNFNATPRQTREVSLGQLAQDIQVGRVAHITIKGSAVMVIYTNGDTAQAPLSQNSSTTFPQVMQAYNVSPDQLVSLNVVYVNPPIVDNLFAFLGSGVSILTLILLPALALVIVIICGVWLGRRLARPR